MLSTELCTDKQGAALACPDLECCLPCPCHHHAVPALPARAGVVRAEPHSCHHRVVPRRGALSTCLVRSVAIVLTHRPTAATWVGAQWRRQSRLLARRARTSRSFWRLHCPCILYALYCPNKLYALYFQSRYSFCCLPMCVPISMAMLWSPMPSCTPKETFMMRFQEAHSSAKSARRF